VFTSIRNYVKVNICISRLQMKIGIEDPKHKKNSKNENPMKTSLKTTLRKVTKIKDKDGK